MTRLIIKIFYFLLLILFTQCAASTKVLNNKDSSKVTALVIFPIYSKIDIIEKGDKHNTSLAFSAEAEDRIKANLINFIPGNTTTRFLEPDSTLEKKIINANLKLIRTIKTSMQPKKIEVEDFLISVLDSLNENYGLFMMQNGFTRTPENLKKEFIKRKTISLASLGFYDTEPNAAYSALIGVLIDKKRKRISMYKELYWRNRNPNEEVVIRSQMRDIILSYFQ